MPLNLVFKALADPTRRRILDLLREGDLTAGEIAAHFQITKPSISHHLNLLKQAGLVEDRRQGQNIVYALNATVFQEVLGWTMSFLHVGEREDGKHREGLNGTAGGMNAMVDRKGVVSFRGRVGDSASNSTGGEDDEGAG